MNWLTLSGAIGASAVLHLLSEYAWLPGRARFIFKPLTTTLIILLAALAPAGKLPALNSLVIAGLILSLAGDVFLLLPTQYFLAGLVAFLAAHIAYSIAFWIDRTGPPNLAVALAVLAYAALFLASSWRQIRSHRLPMTAYAAVITVMVWLAVSRWAGTGGRSSGLAAAGAVAFAISDSLLVQYRFGRRRSWMQAAVLTSYYLAQWLIASSLYH